MPIPGESVGADPKPYPIPLSVGKTITGHVSVPAGVPVVGFEVGAYVVPPRHVHESPVRTAVLADDGMFRLVGLRAGPYVVVVHRRIEGGRWTGEAELDAPAAGVEVDLEFHPDPKPDREEGSEEPLDVHAGQHRIRVSVRTPGGEPLAGGGSRSCRSS